MLAFLLSWALLQGLLQGDAPPPPSPEALARIEVQIEEALKKGELRAIEAAMEAAWDVPHPDVVRRVTRGLQDERVEVKLAALRALRWNRHATALAALKQVAKERPWSRTPQLCAGLLQALGQHADPSVVPILLRDPYEPEDRYCLKARFFGLARIRTREALEGLFTILGVTGSGGERRAKLWMPDARIALMVLTGVDQGLAPEAWEEWWRRNRRDFVVPTQPPLLPKELRYEWESFWGLPHEYEREVRREDRGREPGRPREK